MAGTYNNTTGYLDVNGVYAGELVVGGKFKVDSDWVSGIAKTVHLNDALDSDTVKAISNVTSLTNSVADNDSEIASVKAQLVLVNGSTTTTSNDLVAVNARLSAVENSDTTQSADIATQTTDIADLKSHVGLGVTLTTTAADLAAAVNELDAEIGAATLSTAATTVKGAINEHEGDLGDVSSLTTTATNLAAAINELNTAVASMQTSINDLISRVGGGSTAFSLDDLTDVDVSTAVTGQQLTYNGTGWSAGNDQT